MTPKQTWNSVGEQKKAIIDAEKSLPRGREAKSAALGEPLIRVAGGMMKTDSFRPENPAKTGTVPRCSEGPSRKRPRIRDGNGQ